MMRTKLKPDHFGVRRDLARTSMRESRGADARPLIVHWRSNRSVAIIVMVMVENACSISSASTWNICIQKLKARAALSYATTAKQPSAAPAIRAKELATTAIEKISDPAVPPRRAGPAQKKAD